eukprot:TRINITY_DN22398_c0_g1_i1.p4 TRINITY_DN22398_c0_g1~~TRINITY_DN22398_c0_g1_i1.p4  ORF type:complete len:106 (+),score=28.83 TRINITY_DN22398_c0_g1_i1:148-465(+)
MTFLIVLQVLIFAALMLHTVHLMPAFNRCLRNAESMLDAGYLGAMLTIRLARNILGLILVTASTAPNPDIHTLVGKGIALFLALAAVNVVLTHYRRRNQIEGVRF